MAWLSGRAGGRRRWKISRTNTTPPVSINIIFVRRQDKKTVEKNRLTRLLMEKNGSGGRGKGAGKGGKVGSIKGGRKSEKEKVFEERKGKSKYGEEREAGRVGSKHGVT